MRWTATDIPDQTGRTWIVTGGNSGLGWETCLQLARKRAHVVLACRDLAKGEAARRKIAEAGAEGEVVVRELDLASLASIRRFAERALAELPTIDGLVNNAGIMAIPRAETEDGFEMQLGTNHLGHFALTGLLLDRLAATPGARIVNVSSGAHKMGRVDFDDLDGRKRYEKWGAYGRSKLANLLFTYELDRRVRAAGKQVVVVAAHPGWSATNLQAVGPRLSGSKVGAWVTDVANTVIGQPAEIGALPQLFAATSPEARTGAYYGPDGFAELRGYPKRVDSNARSKDEAVQRRLWDVSVTRTGVDFGGI